MSEEDHSDRNPKTQDAPTEGAHPKKVKITTSAVVHAPQVEPQEELETELGEPETSSGVTVRQADIPAPWSKSEPLTKIHSLLGHMAQGDVYRNDLELVYDRITGDAEAPEFVPVPEEISPDTLIDREEQENTDIEVDAHEEILTDPFADETFDFAVSIGEVSSGAEDPYDQGDAQLVVNAKDMIPMSTSEVEGLDQKIFGEIKVDEFDHLHQTARTSIGVDPEELKANLRPQEIIDDESFSRLSASPDEWEESRVDPTTSVRKRQQSSEQPFFDVDVITSTAVIQGRDNTSEHSADKGVSSDETYAREAERVAEEEDTIIEAKAKKSNE